MMMTVLSPDDRKGELRKLRKSNRAIARATGQSQELVSHVLSGRRLTYEGAAKIMAYVARLLKTPVENCFPELNNRRGEPS
jgi:transcriptional regulator with XRE-family HTH domain